MNQLIERILSEINCPDLLDRIDSLSLSDINSLLMEIMDRQTAKSSAGDLLKRYAGSRFSAPSAIDPVAYLTLEADILRFAGQKGVHAVLLSPASPLGSSSIVGSVQQKNVVSAVRGVEMLSDPTNMLAVYLADKLKKGELDNAQGLHLCTACRVIRAQAFSGPACTTHFGLFGMVSSGRDSGSYSCERPLLIRQIGFYIDFIQSRCTHKIKLILSKREGYTDHEGFFERMYSACQSAFPDVLITPDDSKVHNLYYKGLNFSIVLQTGKGDMELCDGGFTDWTQKLLGNKKERLLISGMGLDRMLLYSGSGETIE